MQERRTIQNNVLHYTRQKWKFDPNSHRPNSKSPESRDQTRHGSTHDPRQPNRDRQYPKELHSKTQNDTTEPSATLQTPRTTGTRHRKPVKTTRKQGMKRGDKRQHNLRPHHPHPAHNIMCPTHTPKCPTHHHPAPPYITQDKHTSYPSLCPSQPSLPRNFECFCQRREATSNKNVRPKRIFRKIKMHTKIHTKNGHKSRHDEKP